MKYITTTLLILWAIGAAAQEDQKVTAKVYGFVRGDAAYDSRQSVTSFDGLFLLYPTDINKDAVGKDINAVPNGEFYTICSRVGLDIAGLKALNASFTGRIEADFAGFSSGIGANHTVMRIRQAFIKMAWQGSSLTVGQTWHPMFGPVSPEVISLSVGAPFNPFARSPQIRYDIRAAKHLTLSAAAVWQLQFASRGDLGKTNVYQRNALLPELFAGAAFTGGRWTLGAGLDYLTIRPRNTSTVGTGTEALTYKVDEKLGSLSWSAYAKYAAGRLSVSAKTTHGQNLSELTMLGGYGVTGSDPVTGERTYTNFNYQTTWAGINYGKKFKGGLFGGISQNLGTGKSLLEGLPQYGDGLTIDRLYRTYASFSYNIPHLMIGLEYEMTTAAYGDTGTFDYKKGKYNDSHNVTNHRLVGVISYLF